MIFTNSFPKYGYILIILISCLFIALLVFLCCYLSAKAKKRNLKITQLNLFNVIIEAVGGKKNISKVSSISSRLSLYLIDNSLFDESKLKEIPINGIIKSSKKITFVIGDLAESYANSIQKELEK